MVASDSLGPVSTWVSFLNGQRSGEWSGALVMGIGGEGGGGVFVGWRERCRGVEG